MGLLLQGGSANIADVQFEGGAGNKTVTIPKEGGRLAVGTMLSGLTAYHLLQGNLSATINANYVEASATTTRNYTTSDYIFDSTNNKLYDCILASTAGALLTNTTYFTAISGGTLSINNAIIPFAQGIDSNGTKVSTIAKNESITGLTYTAGKNYVYALENGIYGVKPYKPRYSRSDLVAEKAGDNPDYFDVLSNTWYSTMDNPELVTNGTFDSGTTGWTAGANTTLSVVNGTLKILNNTTYAGYAYTEIQTVIGKKYKIRVNLSATNTANPIFYIGTSGGSGNIYIYTNNVQIGYTEIEFIAITTTTYLTLDNTNAITGNYTQWDNISVYATDLELNAPITARNYLDTIAYADASGQLTYVEELPKVEYKHSLKVDNFDLGQSWQQAELTNTGAKFKDGSSKFRTLGLTYTNTTGKPIEVIVYCRYGTGYYEFTLNATIDDSTFAIGASDNAATVTSVLGRVTVPNGSTYKITTSPASVLMQWSELR